MPSEDPKLQPVGAALVVGGGIGGMQAALDLAGGGIKVYLVDRKAAIGGVMAQLDKTFPTNDCAMCTMAPRLVEIGRHKDIEILTLSEVDKIEGRPGNFKVTIKQQPRFIDLNKCTGCGGCTEECPVVLPSEFDQGLSERKAIYRPYPQAVPNAFAISRRGPSPCQAACPVHQGGQGYVTLIAQRRFEEALQVILRDNPLPSICGRVCTHPCTDACTRCQIDDPINLPGLKRFITDQFPDYRLPQPTVPDRPERIAIIGSGPAGLVCAYQLRQLGYRPTIFEANSSAGGMLTMGIPSYRLPRRTLNTEIDKLRAIGIEILLDTAVGRSIGFDELRKSFAAMFVAIGAHIERKLGVPGEHLSGVTGGVEFLRRVNHGTAFAPGHHVLVIGGGNSALDAARTALRCGATEVTIVYRRTRTEMPADPREVKDTEREGIKLVLLAAPKSFRTGPDGRVAGLECLKMKLGKPDASGRPTPEPIAGSEFVLPCDAVIVTIGQFPDVGSLGERLGLETTKWGTLAADPLTLETGLPGVFAGGDCVTGPDVVINAELAGKKAAISIDRWLNHQDLRVGRDGEGSYRTEYIVDTAGVLMQRQIHMQALDPTTRGKTFAEVHVGYTEEEAVAEAKRCLACGICCNCQICGTACDAHAIDYTQREQEIELNVGAVVLAPGYEVFDARLSKDLGYERFPNVITSLEFERIMSASGPYSGHVLRPFDRREPKRIAFLQCVGSRDADHDYCSSVCCMYATKEAIIAKEHLGEGLQCDVYFMDLRAFSKGFEQYYRRAQELGVRYIRSRVPMIAEVPGSRNLLVKYLGEGDRKESAEYDLVVLSVGMRPPKDVRVLAERFGIALNEFSFCSTAGFRPAESSREGIYVAGPFVEPKDIPETVMQASAAASQALALLQESRGALIQPKVYPPEKQVKADDEPRIGVFVCHCGTNIAGVVNVPDVVEYAKTLPNVVYAENNLYTCSNDAQDRIKEKIHEHDLNRVVVASCTPRTHEPLFRNTMAEAGLNPYLFEMANIRDQCSWVHMHEPRQATTKSKDLVRMALAKSRLLKPLQRQRLKIEKAALVIGGGLSGMTAALSLAHQGYEVYLVEKEKELGGRLRHMHFLLNGDKPQAELLRIKNEIAGNGKIHVFTGAEIENIEGSIGNFKSRVSAHGKTQEIAHGVVIVATGASQYQPQEYLHGKDDRVITQRELEARLARGSDFLKPNGRAKTVVMIQCVGSRDADHPYCSRVCCSDAIKNALRIKKDSPETHVYVLYRDIRTYGFKESYYTKARQQGVAFVRYDEQQKPEVSQKSHGLDVVVVDPTLGVPLSIAADLVVLSAGIHPHEDNRRIAQFLKVPLNSEGFFLEAHMKLRPVDFMTDGVFLCGLAHSPKTLDESILQAQAASARAGSILARDSVELEASISHVIDEKCDGCAYCVDTCPYKAITLLEYMWQGAVKKVVDTNESICKGCGCCQATCPKDGVLIQGFTLEQIRAQIEAALEVG